ncbi:hypothetical protein [Vulcanisaeta distributa]|uniref:hypothetical protein n=1 Tax=Vulcanisaeta distributa TaxID=164451 RepID=UPI000AEDC053|nr:hypothetical protein [Vulcanisaeta distributa]
MYQQLIYETPIFMSTTVGFAPEFFINYFTVNDVLITTILIDITDTLGCSVSS